MILKFDEVKQENAELYAMVDERDAKIKVLCVNKWLNLHL